MARKFEVVEEDTGCGTRLLRGYMGRFGAYMNIEVPVARSALGENPHLNVSLSVPFTEESEEGEARASLESAREVFDKALMEDVPSELYPGKFDRVDSGEGDLTLDYNYALSIDRSGAVLESMLSEIESITDDLNTGRSTSTKLEQLFDGRLDEKTLGGLTRDIDSELEKVTLQTGSTGVVSFKSDGEVGYGKVSTNQYSLENEHNALVAVKNDGLARILAPTPIGLVKGDGAGALFTWGTENKSRCDNKDVQNYFSVFNTLLFSYAQQNKLNLTGLARDSKVQDVFNRALIHSSGINFDTSYERPEFISLEELEERAGSDIDALSRLREFNPVYREASKRARDLSPGQKVFVHGDARPENVGKDPYGIRPLVDWANAHMGVASSELASLEAKDTQKYLGWYNFVMNFRGGQTLDSDGGALVACHDVMQPYRTASFKIEKGRSREAQRDIKRLERNSKTYQEVFSA
jgi:hypothetical protein